MTLIHTDYFLILFIFAACLQLHRLDNNELSTSTDETESDDGDLDDEFSINNIPFGLAQMQFQKKFIVWPKGVIPYFLDDFSFDKGLRDRIRRYLEDAGLQTGLQFLELPRPPDDNQTRWVLFINRRGLLSCDDFSTINFTNEGVQRVVVGYDCVGAAGSGLAAAVLALAGVPPQHNAPDRDQYIEIVTENVILEKLPHFIRVEKNDWLFENIVYDFNSAGHYDFYQYTKNGRATLRTKTRPASLEVFVDEMTGLSDIDVIKIRNLYESKQETKNTSKLSNCLKVYDLKNVSKSNSNRALTMKKMKSQECTGNNCRHVLFRKIKKLKAKISKKNIVKQLSDFETQEDSEDNIV